MSPQRLSGAGYVDARVAAISSSDRRKGRALLMATAALWSTNGAFIKLIYDTGAGPSAWGIAFYRSLFGGLVLTPAALRRLPGLRWTGWLIASVLAFSAMTVTFIIANTMTTAANAIILEYTAPIWVFALSPILLGERPAGGQWPILLLAMVGVGVIFAGGAGAGLVALLMGLGSGLAFALLTLVLRRLRDVDPIVVAWVNSIGSAVVLLPVVIARFDVHLSHRSLFLLALMGGIQLGLPYALYSWGLKYATAAQAILIILLEPVLNPIWTWMAVGEIPDLETVIGGGMVLAAVAWQAVRR